MGSKGRRAAVVVVLASIAALCPAVTAPGRNSGHEAPRAISVAKGPRQPLSRAAHVDPPPSFRRAESEGTIAESSRALLAAAAKTKIPLAAPLLTVVPYTVPDFTRRTTISLSRPPRVAEAGAPMTQVLVVVLSDGGAAEATLTRALTARLEKTKTAFCSGSAITEQSALRRPLMEKQQAVCTAALVVSVCPPSQRCVDSVTANSTADVFVLVRDPSALVVWRNVAAAAVSHNAVAYGCTSAFADAHISPRHLRWVGSSMAATFSSARLPPAAGATTAGFGTPLSPFIVLGNATYVALHRSLRSAKVVFRVAAAATTLATMDLEKAPRTLRPPLAKPEKECVVVPAYRAVIDADFVVVSITADASARAPLWVDRLYIGVPPRPRRALGPTPRHPAVTLRHPWCHGRLSSVDSAAGANVVNGNRSAVADTPATTRMAVHITVFLSDAPKKIRYLEQMLTAYADFPWRVDVFVHIAAQHAALLRSHAPLAQDYRNGAVHVTVHPLPMFHGTDGFWLAWKHRALLDTQLGLYDVVLNTEDDVLLSARSVVEYWCPMVAHAAAQGRMLGFLRWDTQRGTGRRVTTDHDHRPAPMVRRLANRTVLENTVRGYWAQSLFTPEDLELMAESTRGWVVPDAIPSHVREHVYHRVGEVLLNTTDRSRMPHYLLLNETSGGVSELALLHHLSDAYGWKTIAPLETLFGGFLSRP